ncbi:hypothetical protein DFH08DRAFT_963288 [Mycena albidolilacea]|uniref:DUF6534 domain-containing protein n=1 Tax=Mycena albidolilacea TaxID=1033008 RepID=A0AAD7EN48_9AGAR|nr:hypothetical protein DFH08DRAFT_963288 [Mycena albidolilacea]
MKSMVGAVWCGEVGHAISFGMAVYTIVITNFGHPERLVHFPNSLLAAIFLGSLVSFSVQIFFAFRIYALSRSLWIPCICWALSLFRVVPPNVILFAFSASEPGPELLQRWGPLFIAIWAASAANDLLIAGTLVYLLYQRRSDTFAGTTAVVDKLIRWTIETGVVTSIASVIMLSVFVAMRTTFVWLAFFVVIPRYTFLQLPFGKSQLPCRSPSCQRAQASKLHHACSILSLANVKSTESGGNE